MPTCSECGQLTVWHDDLGSSVCTSCGTLENPSCSILTSHIDLSDNSARQYDPPWHSTLKSIRSGLGWDLPGQAKSVRDRKNNHAMQEFIRSIASRLSDQALSARAIVLFSQAMTAGRYRWGRKAKLTAAVSVAIARRELHRSDSLRTIASVVDEPYSALSTTFHTVTTLLGLSLPSADPTLHLPSLQSYLSTLIHHPEPPTPLPNALRSTLLSLSLPSALQTANALSELLTCLEDSNPLVGLPTPAAACAIFTLALEAEARSALPHLGDFAHLLASHVGISKSVVMMRYRLVYDLVQEWIKELPWLDKFETKNGRSKLAKRVVVARGLKDVVQFRNEIHKRKLEALEHPALVLDMDEEARDDGIDNTLPLKPSGNSTISARRRKKRKYRHEFDDAFRFLLDPLSAPCPSSTDTSLPSSSSLHWTTYLLAASPLDLSSPTGPMPTRLQRLAAERGESAIGDDELFEDGEWETILRGEEEMEVLRNAMGWGRDEDEEHEEHQSQHVKTGGSKKINMEVLSKLLHGTDTLVGEEEWLDSVDEHPSDLDPQDQDRHYSDGKDFRHFGEEEAHRTDESDVLENWRPLSPGGTDTHDLGDRYDEEC